MGFVQEHSSIHVASDSAFNFLRFKLTVRCVICAAHFKKVNIGLDLPSGVDFY